ncbi:MAG TPA: alpha-amylase family glycosyl hydrolase, partial [Caldilineaceae bacterium]|nr:alpha-amylase family glycosyl hydrolase [Caldilineaceae bacterium]
MTPLLDSTSARAEWRGLMAPPDVRGGAHPNLMAEGAVTFVLNAPYKPYVSLVGDFNGWDSRAHRMVTDGSGLWWITLPHPGETRYGFYVAIDDQSHAWVGDPYAQRLRWTGEEPWAYLPAQPVEFTWTDQEWRTPPLRDLVIYELCVRDFAGGWRQDRHAYGNFQAMLRYVDYLAALGINAVELMPVQAFPGESSWGYNPVFYFALAQVYGEPEDLKAFVNACHARGIAVILDVAFNHAWGQHPYYLIYPEMYGPHGEWLADWNPYFHHTPRAVNMWGGVDWDHFTAITTRYFQDVVRYWLQEYHIDGFRFDWVCGVDYDSNDPMRPGFHPYHGISAIAWAARQAKPDCILIGEYWQLPGTHPDKTAAKLVAETEVDAVWNGLFHHILDHVLNQRWQWEKLDIFRALGGFREQGFPRADMVINYTCSHDEVRPEHEIKFYSWPNIRRPRGMSVQELALAKARLGLAALFTAPGVPMIYAGQEYGEDAPRTIDFNPLNWERLKRADHRAHYDFVCRMIRARRTYSALRSDAIWFETDNFERDRVVRFHRWDEESTVLVALNFGETSKRVTLPIPWAGRWRDL